MSELNYPVITIAQLVQILREQIETEQYIPILGLGLSGIGKSESIASLAREMHIGFKDLRLLLYEQTDIKGIPFPNEDKTQTLWLPSKVLPQKDIDGEAGILLLDEVTSCSNSLRTAAYQLLQERTLGDYRLPDKWIVLCMGNGPEDGGDFQGLEGAFVNRGMAFRLKYSVREWCNWAEKSGLHSSVVKYIRFKTSDLHTFNLDKEYNQFASPRAWKNVSDILKNSKKINELTFIKINGLLGVEIGQQFEYFYKSHNEKITVLDVLQNNEIIKRTDELSQEETMILLNGVIRTLKGHLATHSGQIEDELANGINWIASLNCNGASDMKLMAIKDLTKDNEEEMLSICMSSEFSEKCEGFNMLASFIADIA